MKRQIINQFTRQLVDEKKRKNGVTRVQITSSLTLAALNSAFVNESCKSSGQISKGQIILRKIEDKSKEQIHDCFGSCTSKFLKMLNIFSRNRRLTISYDTTYEAFYGDYAKLKEEDRLYLHKGSKAKNSEGYYEYLTTSITFLGAVRYVLDGIIVPVGFYKADYVDKMLSFIKKHISIGVCLFDRGFTDWELVEVLKKQKINYIIFWQKKGEWFKPYFDQMKDGEFKSILKEGIYKRYKSNNKVCSNFVLVKQLEHENKKYDWIFATNLYFKKAEAYVKLYKKRWGIETIYRVTDKIRIYTTSTNHIKRYFLFMFTCLVYNVWKWSQSFIANNFTLSNFKTCMIIYLTKQGLIYPVHYYKFEHLMSKFNLTL